MQLNKESDTAKWLTENSSFLLEESVWSANNTDYVVFIPVTNPKDGLFKKDMKGVKHLKLIKLVQENWVIPGTRVDRGISPKINHNVSNTVIIDNQEEICNYIWENKDIFTAVSFISDYGDKDFNQAPFTSILSAEEIFEKYGKGSLFISGLIVDGLHYFNNNLWEACDCILDVNIPICGTREQVMLKKYWVGRAKKFAKNYFKNDIKQMIYCLKDVHLCHKWEAINRQIKEIDFGKILPEPVYKDVSDYAAVACAGGSCELTRI
jgi:ribonucleoside-diphosphate reductase alpha chain